MCSASGSVTDFQGVDMKTITLTPAQAERFWSNVEKSEDCWTWTKALTAGGYGNFFVEGKRPYAHRVSFSISIGPIPQGMKIDHMCHNTACVKPAHLRLATHKQNMENQSGLTSVNKSGHRGVAWMKDRNKWRAQVRHNGKTIRVGLFDDPNEAGRAALEARNEMFTHNLMDR